jgi:putative AlgH/UPF0301 family transcriptional regulator
MQGHAHFRLKRARLLWIAAAVTIIVTIMVSKAAATRRPLFVPTEGRPRAKDLATGKILVARRSLADPNFAETVILLVQHDDEGTLGLIINQKTKIPLSRLSPEMESAKGRSDPLYRGGPVQPAAMMALLRSRTKPEDAKPVAADIYMISSKAGLEKTIASNASADTFRAYLGYAGWDAGQLAWELKMDAWDVLPANTGIVFDQHPETLWARLAREEEMRLASAGFGYLSGGIILTGHHFSGTDFSWASFYRNLVLADVVFHALDARTDVVKSFGIFHAIFLS